MEEVVQTRTGFYYGKPTQVPHMTAQQAKRNHIQQAIDSAKYSIEQAQMEKDRLRTHVERGLAELKKFDDAIAAETAQLVVFTEWLEATTEL